MDALIMAAGRGSRLGHETDVRPKCLVDLGGITPLEFQLGVLASRDVRRVFVVTGYRHDLVEGAVERFAPGQRTARCIWNPFWPLTNVLGSVWSAHHELHEDLIYLHGDTIFDPSILDDLLEHRGEAVLPVDMRPCEPEQMKAKIEEGTVRRLSKALGAAEAAGEFIGIGVFRRSTLPALLEGMEQVLEMQNFGAYFEEAVNWAINDRGLRIDVVATRGRPWTEIDFPDDLHFARTIISRIVAR